MFICNADNILYPKVIGNFYYFSEWKKMHNLFNYIPEMLKALKSRKYGSKS